MPTISHPAIQDLTIEQVLYALSDPTRLAIVAKLAGVEEAPCQIFDYLGKKNNLSHHYKTLRENGIIHVRTEGRHRYLALRDKELNQKFPNLIDTILKSYELLKE